MDNKIDYEKDMRIDDTALDVEWLDQAELALKYGRHWAECKKILTEAEEKIKIIRAELIKRANSDPVRFCGKEKPNAPDIESYYRQHSRHKAAKAEWIEAQFELNMAEVAKNEISFTRKAALENMVTLHGQSYFAGPSMPRNLTSERNKKQKEVDSGIANKLNRKRKRNN